MRAGTPVDASGGPATPADAAIPRRRARPVLVELASALLIIGGGVNLLLSIEAIGILATEGSAFGGLTLATIVVGIVILAIGVLVRSGRAWLLAVNVVAVLAFLELISQTPIGLLFGVVDTLVVLMLFRERAWFQAPAETGESDLRSYGG